MSAFTAKASEMQDAGGALDSRIPFLAIVMLVSMFIKDADAPADEILEDLCARARAMVPLAPSLYGEKPH